EAVPQQHDQEDDDGHGDQGRHRGAYRAAHLLVQHGEPEVGALAQADDRAHHHHPDRQVHGEFAGERQREVEEVPAHHVHESHHGDHRERYGGEQVLHHGQSASPHDSALRAHGAG